MKVLLVATVQSHICQFHRPLISMLHRYGCEVHVAARNNLEEKNGLKLDFVEKIFDIPFQRSPFSPNNIGAYKQLKNIIDRENYDVVHCNTPVGGVLGRLAARKARKCGTKVFYTAHGFHFYKGAPKKNWLLWYPIEKFMCRYTDKLITITQEDYELATAKFPTRVERIHGVGANSEKYKQLSKIECSNLRKMLGYSENEKLVLCTGELLPNKNQLTAIRAMKLLITNQLNIKLLIAGNGPMLPDLQSEVEKLGLKNNVEFIGYRNDLERFANIADIVISCSYREGLPMNIVEGMMLKKPVVVSSNRGHRELVVPGITGFMVSAKDYNAFAEKIALLTEKTSLADNMGCEGYKKAQYYKDTAVSNELEKLYFFLSFVN